MCSNPGRRPMPLRGVLRRPGLVGIVFVGLIAAHGLVRPRTAGAQHVHRTATADTVVPGIQHPEPRAGITADRVIAAEQLIERPDAARVVEMVREIPHVLDGIHCWCGCHERSLLSCFEGEEAMGRWCRTCQAQAELAYRLHQEGKTLDQIRPAIDAEFMP